MKRSPIKRTGKGSYHRRRDKKYFAWCGKHAFGLEGEDRASCWSCGAYPTERAHLEAKSRGGYDAGNIALLCYKCHKHQEKWNDPEYAHVWKFNLLRRAKDFYAQYLRETGGRSCKDRP